MYTQNNVKEIKYKVINHYTSSSHLKKQKRLLRGKLQTNRTGQRSHYGRRERVCYIV